MLLEVMAFTTDVSHDFTAVGEANFSYLTES
jgi:hypothetical protein